MIAVAFWCAGCCLLAQLGEEGAGPNLKPRLSPRRTAPAATFDPESRESAGSRSSPGEDEPPGRSSYPRRPAARGHEATDNSGRGDRSGLEHVGTAHRKLRPPELLAEAIASPRNGRLKGHPIALVDVLGKVADRSAQKKAVIAYWRLAIAQAQYHYALAAHDQLQRWSQGKHKLSTLTESQLAAALAAVDDAELNVLKASTDLGALIAMDDGERVLWAIDRPHVGDYRTEYEKLRAPSARVRLIHRTLPISRRAIDVHGEALVAALDALETTEEEYRGGHADYLTVSACFDRLNSERRNFLQSVLRYNEDIAEYVFVAASDVADSRDRVKSLITHPSRGTQSQSQTEDTVVETPAASGPTDAEPSDNELIPRTFRESSEPSDEPALNESGHLPRLKVWLVANQQQAHGGLYQGLLNVTPALRAQKLAELLNWDRELPADSGSKTTLGAMLERATDRRAAIQAYWQTRESVARYQVLSERSAALSELLPRVLALRSEPGGSGAMLRLQAARQAAQAAVSDEHIRMLTAEFELTQLSSAGNESTWMLPITSPHAGSYNVTRHSAEGAARPRLASASARVLVLHSGLEHQARAVVFADEHRALLTHLDERRAGAIDTTLAAIDRQVRETQLFLRTLTHYNSAIADYALELLPPGTPAGQLVEKLVVERKPASNG